MVSAMAWVVGAALVGAAAAPAVATVTARQVSYQGWEGAYELSNGAVELVVVPQIGRILVYRMVGGPNMLWENPDARGKTVDPAAYQSWFNPGGDKVFNAPQAPWGWPPDPYLDFGPYKATLLPGNRLRLDGPPSPKMGVRYTREISLASRGTQVTLRNTIENTSGKDQQWTVWEVAQVGDPDYAELGRSQGKFAGGYYVFESGAPAPGRVTVTGDVVRITRDPKKNAKIGTDSPSGWVASVKNGLRFVLSARVESGAPYPDDGCSQEIYTNDDTARYVELELLAPLRGLKPGRKQTLVTRWRLEPVKER